MSEAWPSQEGFDARFDWGPAGVERLARSVSTLVIVDVLRFTTAVETACSAGEVVYPYRWKDDSAAAFAESLGAILAGSAPGGPSLSPRSLLGLPAGAKVVLPSPNGAACSLLAVERGAKVAAGCLRNASAVAAWLQAQVRPVGVIACGEVWSDGSIRPAVEDLLGAGAILARLRASRSPEAEAAAFEAASSSIARTIRDCASGRQLTAMGRAADLDWCSALDASTTVPVIRDGAFHPLDARTGPSASAGHNG